MPDVAAMATTASLPQAVLPMDDARVVEGHLPNLATPEKQRQRFSGVDAQFPSLYSTGSPAQAKRALEAHLAETERRLQEASRLGTILVKQRKELGERLKEVDKQSEEEQVAPELREQLQSLEREVNEVSRESARTFLSRSRIASGEGAESSTLAGEVQNSPSKVQPPSSRKQRNQPSSRVNDIKLATDISHSLLNQVRELQAAYAEKEEALKSASNDQLRLETDMASLRQRLRTLDESEQRFKDENWSLETQVSELATTQKELSNRSQKLQQQLNAAQSQHASALRDFEEAKQANGKLTEDHQHIRKQHETETSELRRDLQGLESEKSGLQRKIEELISQNKELAKAISYRIISAEHNMAQGDIPDSDDAADGRTTPEQSPPGSPSKATPRHGALESETLKSSLQHAHRMIQNLKNNIHREKTEKLELKRMLQDARDDIDGRRGQGAAAENNKKAKTASKEVFKKPARPGALGAVRSSQQDIITDDEDWEEHDGTNTPSKRPSLARQSSREGGITTDTYATATENSDAFETATERGGATETEAFQTVAESMGGESTDELTETEGNSNRRTLTNERPNVLNRYSFLSTASLSDDDAVNDGVHTPLQGPKYKSRATRASRKLSRAVSGTPQSALAESVLSRDSPMSTTSQTSTPAAGGQSLFAELGDMSDEEVDENGNPLSSSNITPESRSMSRISSPALQTLPLLMPTKEKPEQIDASTMTEQSLTPVASTSGLTEGSVAAITAAVPASLNNESTSSKDRPEQNVVPALAEAKEHEALATKSLSEEVIERLHRPVFGFSSINEQSFEPVEPRFEDPITVVSTPVIAAPAFLKPLAPSHPLQRIALSKSQLDMQDFEPVGAPSHGVDRAVPLIAGFGPRAHSNEPLYGLAQQVADRVFAAPVMPDGLLYGEQPKEPNPTGLQGVRGDGTDQENIAVRSGAEVRGRREPLQPTEGNRQAPEPVAMTFVNKAGAPGVPVAEDPQQSSTPISTMDFVPPNSSSADGSVFDANPRRVRASSVEGRNRRPGSSGSTRSRLGGPPPPLPNEARQVIAAAGHRAPHQVPGSSTPGKMGPPLMPASAYKRDPYRPQTPIGNVTVFPSPRKNQNFTRPMQPSAVNRSRATSPATTRRSSVSSFASELDQRFNIARGTMDHAHFDPSMTDPRMIQAITQTMIGEWLWKYTRKPGREEISGKRHRRFFWIHPYTRTLYWSEHDPSRGGKTQMKAKSVAIESVHMINDENPMPPGLHRKSIVVTTPGRSITFTATTSQRHETWFNALSYLLLRTGTERAVVDDDYDAQDVAEFNPTLRSSSRMTGRSRKSMASYMGRSQGVAASPVRQNMSFHHGQNNMTAVPDPAPAYSAQPNSISGRLSSIGGVFRSGSARGRTQHTGPMMAESTYDQMSVDPRDSAEDLRQVIEAQERQADRLENVRACCDGKHDVGSLTHRSDLTNTSGKHVHTATRNTRSRNSSSVPHSRKGSIMDPADVVDQ